jgi:hypothetical protein
MIDKWKKQTLSGNPPDPNYIGPAPASIDEITGMHKDYWILSNEERVKEFVRPVRNSYIHLKCGAVTKMGIKLAETYAANPEFYGATFCCACKEHFPVGENGEFVWDEPMGPCTTQKEYKEALEKCTKVGT